MAAWEWLAGVAAAAAMYGGTWAFVVRSKRRAEAARQTAVDRTRRTFDMVASRLALKIETPAAGDSYLLRASGEYRACAVAVELAFRDMLGPDSPRIISGIAVLAGTGGEPAPSHVSFGSGAEPNLRCHWGRWKPPLARAAITARARSELASLSKLTDEIRIEGRWLLLAPTAARADRIRGGGTEYQLVTDPDQLVRWIDVAIDTRQLVLDERSAGAVN